MLELMVTYFFVRCIMNDVGFISPSSQRSSAGQRSPARQALHQFHQPQQRRFHEHAATRTFCLSAQPRGNSGQTLRGRQLSFLLKAGRDSKSSECYHWSFQYARFFPFNHILQLTLESICLDWVSLPKAFQLWIYMRSVANVVLYTNFVTECFQTFWLIFFSILTASRNRFCKF